MRAADGTIAGSALRIDEALRNYMSYAQIPFAQAIVAATHAPARSSTTKARWAASRAVCAPISHSGTRSTESSPRWSAAASSTTAIEVAV